MDKRIILIIPFLFLLLFSCSITDNDCICTQEFVMYTVLILDENNQPAENLQTTVTNGKGVVLEILSSFPEPGIYVVMDDSHTEKFSTTPEKIFFSATGRGKSVTGEYLFNTDKCKCHVNKIAGPDTLIVN